VFGTGESTLFPAESPVRVQEYGIERLTNAPETPSPDGEPNREATGDRPGLLDRLVAEGVVTHPLDKKGTLPHQRITPTAPVSPLIIEDRR